MIFLNMVCLTMALACDVDGPRGSLGLDARPVAGDGVREGRHLAVDAHADGRREVVVLRKDSVIRRTMYGL
jgi:hypothetical protein